MAHFLERSKGMLVTCDQGPSAQTPTQEGLWQVLLSPARLPGGHLGGYLPPAIFLVIIWAPAEPDLAPDGAGSRSG